MQVMVGNNYGSYVFDPSARTITLSGLPSAFSQNQLKLIIDSATNTILFNLVDNTKTATVSGNIITLAVNTSALNSSDPLQIFLEVPEIPVSLSPGTTIAATVEVTDGTNVLGVAGHPIIVDGSSNTQPVSITGTPTIDVGNFPTTQQVSFSSPQHVIVDSVGSGGSSNSSIVSPVDVSGNVKVVVENTVPVTGTFYPTTQPVSGTVSAVVSGSISNTVFGANQGIANTSSNAWPIYNTVSGTAIDPRQTRLLTSSDAVTIANSTIPVTGTFWPATQPISVSSLPLPTGAAISSKQPSLNGDGGALSHITNFPAIQDVLSQEQVSTSYYPAPYNYKPSDSTSPLVLDTDGHLITRGLAMSDEGSFRDCFSGTSLNNNLTGTVTFVNGSSTVTGVGTSFITEVRGTEYDAVKLSTDIESKFAIVYSVESDTSLTLVSPYTGTSGSGTANQTRWIQTISSGGSITVSSSNVNIIGGVGNNSLTGITQVYSDYAPLVIEFYGSIDNSIAGRTVVFGLQDVMGSPTAQVTVQFDGITNAGLFVTSVTGDVNDTDSLYFSLPGTSIYLDEHKYRISLANNRATLSVDEVVVASNTLHLPPPYTELFPVAYIQNNGIPAGETTFSLDFVYLSDVDRIEINSSFDESLHTSISGPNDTNNVTVTVTPYNALRVAPSSTQILFEPFSTDINTEIWNVSSGNGGSNPYNGGLDNGNVIYDPGTTVNGFSLLQTKDSFSQTAPGFLLNVWVVALDATATTNNYRFWGLANTLVEPNLTTPIIDGYGFEIGIDGNLYAVCYQGTVGTTTTRVVINNLSNVQPLDGMPHTYYTFSIASEIYWSIDSKENIVASYRNVLLAPHYFKLPLTALSISNGSAQTLVTAGLVLGDDSHLGSQLVDGTYAWRKATIKKASTPPISTDTSLVVSLHPSGSLPAGTNVIGSVDINSGQTIAVTQGTSPWVTSGTVTSKLQDGSGNAITSTSSALDVNIKSGGGTTQYSDGVTQATPTGTVTLGQNPSNVLKPLQVDSNGYLEVNVVGGVTISGGSFSPASDGPTGSAVPLDASFFGYKDGSGNLIGVGTTTPMPVTGSITATNPSVGVVGSAVVSSSTQIGFSSGGNLTVPSTSNPLPVAVVSGSVDANVTNIVPVSQSGTWSTRLVGNSGASVDAVVEGSQPANLLQVGGQTTLANPTYTTGKQDPLSLTTSGGVRTDISSVAGIVVTAVPSTFGANPTGSVQGVNASIFAGTTSVPSGTFGTSPTAVTGTLPVNASLYIGTTQVTTTGTPGQPLVGAITYVSGSPVDPRQIRAITSSDQITIANSSLSVTASQVGTWTTNIVGSTGTPFDTSSSQNQASPAGMVLIGGEYNTTPTTITSGNVSPLQLDNNGDLLVNINDPLPTGTNTIGNVVLSSSGGTLSSVFPSGRLNVNAEPSQLFVDIFDTFDTVNNWLSPVAVNGGISPTVSAGNLILGTGTITGGYSYLQSVPNFPPAAPAFLTAQFVLQLEFPVILNTYRFWGFGFPSGIPTISQPFSNAIGFELNTDGKLYAVVYANSVRTVIQDLSTSTGNGKQPVDGNPHRYSIARRSDKQFFMIDSTDPVATGNYIVPTIQTLPVNLLTIAGSSPVSSGYITLGSIGVGDSGANNITISDSVYGWRGTTVGPEGNLHVSGTGVVGSNSPSIVSALGFNSSGILKAVSNIDISTALPVTENTLISAKTNDSPIFVAVTGDPTGDFAGINLLEAAANAGGDLGFNVRVQNPGKLDVTGAFIESDAVASGPYFFGSANQSFVLDTTGYSSISLGIVGIWAGTVSFYCSNDFQTWQTVNGITSNTPQSAVGSTTSNGQFIFPVMGRYFKAQITTYTSGLVTIVPYLRLSPFPVPLMPYNMAQVAGTNTVTAGVGGMAAVGGNIAVANAPTAYPVLVGGTDYNVLTRRIQTDVAGNITPAGPLPVGYQVGVYNQKFNNYTGIFSSNQWPTITAINSSPAPVILGGVDQTGTVRNHLLDTLGNTLINSAPSAPGIQSIQDLLTQLLAAVRVSNYYLYELYSANSVFRNPSEEPDILQDEFTNGKASFNNLIN